MVIPHLLSLPVMDHVDVGERALISVVVALSLAQPPTDVIDVVIILLALIVAEFHLAGPGIRVVVAVSRARPTINAESVAITPHVWTA